MRWHCTVIAGCVLGVVPAPEAARAQEFGVTEDAVVFGQSAPFSGPARQLGTDFGAGLRAAFAEANRRGGVHGRQLQLIALDDAYEPDRSANNTKRLIEEDHVFALIGAVGTPTSLVAAPIAAESDVPFIAPFTGAEFLRDEAWTNIVNLRASYYQETREIVDRLIEDLAIERIAVLFQDDSYGRAGLDGVRVALKQHGLDLAAIGVYTRNTTAVKTALLELRGAAPGAVVLIGAYAPVATAIRWARHIGFDPVFATISFSAANALPAALGDAGAGVYVTQVVPFPSTAAPVASAYLRALKRSSPGVTPSFVSLEGYLAGRLAIVGLQRAGASVTRASFLENVLQGPPVVLDGFRLNFGSGDNQGSDRVFLTMIGTDMSYEPARRMEYR